MSQPQIAGAIGVIATADKQSVEKAKDLFERAHISRTAADLQKEVQGEIAADVLLLDLELPKLDGTELVKIIKAMPSSVSIILLSTKVNVELFDAMRAGAEDYLLKPFLKEDLDTRIRIRREGRHRASRASMDPPLPYLVEKLHDPKDGHLDAVKVADFLALPVAELARAIGRGVSTVHKTPTAPSLQEPLRVFESLVSGLLRLTGSERRARMWLQASNPALDGHAPIELLRMGKVGDLAAFVQDLLEGRPA